MIKLLIPSQPGDTYATISSRVWALKRHHPDLRVVDLHIEAVEVELPDPDVCTPAPLASVADVHQLPTGAPGEKVQCPDCSGLFAPIGLTLHRRRAHGVPGASRLPGGRKKPITPPAAAPAPATPRKVQGPPPPIAPDRPKMPEPGPITRVPVDQDRARAAAAGAL